MRTPARKKDLPVDDAHGERSTASFAFTAHFRPDNMPSDVLPGTQGLFACLAYWTTHSQPLSLHFRACHPLPAFITLRRLICTLSPRGSLLQVR